MKLISSTILGLSLMGMPLFAGDASKGETVFKKCRSCHSIVDASGTAIQKGGKTGPNLFGVVGRTAGTFDGFKYSKSMQEAGAAGLSWNEDDFVNFVADPKKFLAGYLDDSKARSKMTFKLKNASDAADVWAYFASVSP